MKLIYNLTIYLLTLIFFVGRFFSSKLNLGYQGRRNWKQKLTDFKKNNPGNIIWIHCASLGEYEMARPLIDELNLNRADDLKIFISFFSPSGYELKKNDKSVDALFYMPLDTPNNAKIFISILKPKISVFVKYEFWLNHLEQAKIQGSKVLLINGIFRKDQLFFKLWGSLFKEGLKNYEQIFVQNKASQKVLETINIINTTVTGDLRYDRVIANSKKETSFNNLELFFKDSFIIIGGSTWPDEEWVLKQCKQTLGSAVKLVIVPHDVAQKNLIKIEKQFEDFSLKRFSQMTANDHPEIVLVDTIGHLSALYRYATVALIGGGFSGALHNIIEPAVFGIPVFYGYKYSKFPEADYFKKSKIGISIHNGFNFTEHIKEMMAKPELLEAIKFRTPKVFKPHLGGTQQVFYKIKGYL